MNGYERIHAGLEGKKSDKVPVTLHNFLLASHEAGYTQGQYREDPKKIAQTFIRAVEEYDYDGILLDLDTASLAGALGVPVDFPEDECARCTDSRLASIRDIETLGEPDVLGYKYIDIWLEAARILTDHFKKTISVRGNCDQAPFSLASLLRGTQSFLMDLLDEQNQDHVLRLLEYCTKASLQFLRAMAQTGVDILSNGDSIAGPAMISPKMYEKYALPYEKQIIKAVHQLNLPYVLHICGNTDQILKFIPETGTDGIELDYLTDIDKIYEMMHDSVTFLGNIDPSGVLTYGTPGEVQSRVQSLLEKYSGSNRFILNSGCAIPSTAPRENIKMMIKTARDFR